MSEWTRIILEAEDMWRNSALARNAAVSNIDVETYCIIRDAYKARRILDLYGEDYFFQFVSRCPHIKEEIKDYLPCVRSAAQCNMFCIFYEGGCTNATE